MNDFRKLAKILIVCPALFYVFIYSIQLILSVLVSFQRSFSSAWATFSGLLLSAGMIFILIFFVIGKSDLWAKKIAGKEEDGESLPRSFSLAAAYRLICVFVGLLYFYWVVPSLISAVKRYIQIATQGDSMPIHGQGNSASDIINWVVIIAVGIYLLCGAPAFVRWQVRKTKEFEKRTSESGQDKKIDAV